MEQANHYVDVKGLSKHFGASKVFEDLSFAIEEGEFITLLGPSGCGKSTLLRCLAGLETPDEGSIFVNGEEVTSYQTSIKIDQQKSSKNVLLNK